MKRMLAFVVAFVLLVGVTPAQAQGLLGGGYRPSSLDGWYYYIRGDRVHMLQAEQVNFVAETLNIDRRAIRPVTEDIAQSGPYVGLQGQKGFYPMYKCSRSQRWLRGGGITLLATAIGYAIGHTTKYGEWEGAATGFGAGAGLAMYLDANKCAPIQNQMVVIDDPSDLGDDDGDQPTPRTSGVSGRENGWNEILREQRYGNQPQIPARVELEWQMLRNEFQGVTIYARVQGFDPSKSIVISPGQTETVQIPRGAQIWAEALICLDENCTVRKWRQDVGRRPLPQGAGWVFYNPEEGR